MHALVAVDIMLRVFTLVLVIVASVMVGILCLLSFRKVRGTVTFKIQTMCTPRINENTSNVYNAL